jgi:hypothetical protein
VSLGKSVAAVVAALVLVGTGAVSAQAAPAPNGIGVLAGYRTVTANSLTLWNAPSGGSAVGSWSWGQCFYWSAVEGSNRYRTSTGSGATVWVSADPAWSVAGC